MYIFWKKFDHFERANLSDSYTDLQLILSSIFAYSKKKLTHTNIYTTGDDLDLHAIWLQILMRVVINKFPQYWLRFFISGGYRWRSSIRFGQPCLLLIQKPNKYFIPAKKQLYFANILNGTTLILQLIFLLFIFFYDWFLRHFFDVWSACLRPYLTYFYQNYFCTI